MTGLEDHIGKWALSIRQPWAWAIVAGFKRVENRTWKTDYRGPVLIHASQTEDQEDIGAMAELAADRTGLEIDAILDAYRTERRTGGICGAASLRDVATASDDPWFCGPYGLILGDQRMVPFVECRGKLGLFVVTRPPPPPDDLFRHAGMRP